MDQPSVSPELLLERTLAAALRSNLGDEIPSKDRFYDMVFDYRRRLQGLATVSDEQFDTILKHLVKEFTIAVKPGRLIVNPGRHKPWVSHAKPDLDFYYWNRYKKYLGEQQHWNGRMTATLDSTTDDLLDLLGDPRSSDPFRRRGLILGDVQSGKTAQYIGLINKAADAGYRVVIVLAGLQNNLREQTQRRLDAQFTGNDSSGIKLGGTFSKTSPIGVGLYGNEPQRHVATFTTALEDFSRVLPKHSSIDLQLYNGVVLCVVKKQHSVLNNLLTWLQDSINPESGKINLPLLLIDDESDNASINTNRESEDPTTINTLIRRILNLFTQTSYVGITATPYANIFIHPDTADEMLGDDLFPRDFIYVMSPPDNYIGAARIFGSSDRPSEVELVPLHSSELDAYFPYWHKKTLEVDELPPSMKKAAAYFLLANVVRDLRGDTTAHRSMLVHVSRFTNVQTQTKEALNEWLVGVQGDVLNYAAVPSARDAINSLRFLHEIWDKYDFDTLSGTTWDDVCSKQLYRSIAPICVREVNQASDAGLDYARNEENGLRVIAVGGNSLSRGLTLEGLMVSYFYRRSMMYDTLMQMGRWFGYRDGYEDLTKLWISQDAIDWYGRISDATEELKSTVKQMRAAGRTPQEFGLMVRSDPEALLVTAQNKMRNASIVRRPVVIDGRLLETPRLYNDDASLEGNEKAVRDFVRKLSDVGKLDEQAGGQNYYWHGVPKELVSSLVRQFKSHPWHLSFQSDALASYIDDTMDDAPWDIVVMNSGQGDPLPDGLVCGPDTLPIEHTAKRHYLADKQMISISGTKVRVGSGGCTKIGLSADRVNELTAEYQKENPGKNPPDNAYLVSDRPPLLMIHPLQMVSSDDNDDCKCPEFVFALGLGFPATGDDSETKTAEFVVNLVELRNFIDPSELEQVEE